LWRSALRLRLARSEWIGLVILTMALHSLIGLSPPSGFLCLCSIAGANHGIARFPVRHKSGRMSLHLFYSYRILIAATITSTGNFSLFEWRNTKLFVSMVGSQDLRCLRLLPFRCLLSRFDPTGKRRILLQMIDNINERETAHGFGRSSVLDHPRNKRWNSGAERRVARCTDGWGAGASLVTEKERFEL
jgi:hypothetical protein